jgi:hypothetical protein
LNEAVPVELIRSSTPWNCLPPVFPNPEQG